MVFKVITKEIVTTSMYWLGEKGKKYFFGKTTKIIEVFEGAKYV